jgi:hypothetical protein
MAKKPEDRFQTPAQLAQVLETIFEGRPAPVSQAKIVSPSRTRAPDPHLSDTATFLEIPAPPLRSPSAVKRLQRRRLTRWHWVVFNGIGVALLILLVGLLVVLLRGDHPTPFNPKSEEPLPGPESQALLEWERLRRRQGEATADKTQLWQDVLHFRQKYAATPQALQAAILLRSLPSPLDSLKRETLPPPLFLEPRPLEIVARLTPSGGRGGASQGVVFCPDGRHLLQLRKVPPGAILWDVATGKDLRRFDRVKEEVRCAAFSPSGNQVLLGCSPPRLSIWDVAAGTEVGRLDGHTWAVTAVAWSPDGKMVLSGSRDHSVRLWDQERNKMLHRFEGHAGEVTGVAFSNDGQRAYSASTDKTLRCWDLTAGQERLPLGEFLGPVACLCLLPEGKKAVAGGTKGMRCWSLDPLEITGLLGHQGPVSLLAVSGDGQLLAAGHSNGWLGVWNLASGQKLKERRLLPPLTGLSFAADGRHLAASWGMGNVSIFR